MTASERIAAIRAREQAATPGPWRASSYDGRYAIRANDRQPVAVHVCCEHWVEDGDPVVDCSRGGPLKKHDAQFCAEARADIPWLLARLERAEALLRDCCSPNGTMRDGVRIMNDTAEYFASDDTTTKGSDNGK